LLGCVWTGCKDDLNIHKKICEHKPTMELCQEIKEKNEIINQLTMKLDAATLTIAELVDENRSLKMKVYECDRKFRIYDAFLNGRGDDKINHDDYNSSSKVDDEVKDYLTSRYYEDKKEIHIRDGCNDYDFDDRTRKNINDDVDDGNIQLNKVKSTVGTESDDIHNLMKLRNLRSFDNS